MGRAEVHTPRTAAPQGARGPTMIYDVMARWRWGRGSVSVTFTAHQLATQQGTGLERFLDVMPQCCNAMYD